jgi:hypothetical protein
MPVSGCPCTVAKVTWADRLDHKELQARDVEQHAFLSKEVERLKARAAAVDELEQENRALKDELRALRSQLRPSSSAVDGLHATTNPAPSVTRRPLGELSANTPSRTPSHKANPKDSKPENVSAARFAQLQEEYAKLANTCERLRHVKDATNAAARKQQEEKENWIKYAKKLEAKLKRTKKDDHERGRQTSTATEPARPGLDSPRRRVEADPSGAKDLLTPKATPGYTARPHPSATASFSGFEKAGLAEPSPRRAASSPPDSRLSDPIEPASDSTEGDDDDAVEEALPKLPPNDLDATVLVKSEPSSDLPVVVSERRVGKRKRIDDVADDMIARRVKIEERSSDPLIMGESHHFSPQESLDLDTDGTMPTPRRMRMLQLQDQPEVLRPGTGNPRDRSTMFDVKGSLSRTNPGNDEQPPHVSVKDMRVHAAVADNALSGSSVRRRRAPDGGVRLRHGVANLAEDGYDPSQSGRQAAAGNQSGEAPSRLSTLLNVSSPSPQAQIPLLRPNRQNREAIRSDPWLTETPVRVLPFGKGDATNRDVAAISNPTAGGGLDSPLAGLRPTPRVLTPKAATPLTNKSKAASKRLRDEPLARLGLDSFKINPRFNNGHDFAFTEVVRNRDERAEIPGCVDPNCCGKYFRAMAQSELEAAGPSLIHRQADIALLEDYLGDQVYKLGSMTRQEKEELWLEAKTRELANKHGKHRHRFMRRQSPPGFWNADFPSTQENQKDREEGEKRERRMVEERYREAMREGGRWLFRDE